MSKGLNLAVSIGTKNADPRIVCMLQMKKIQRQIKSVICLKF